MTARDNAETADLTLEVGSLREQLKESEGKCRALTVESEVRTRSRRHPPN